MLALSELTLSHFRSHRRAVLAVDPRPIAIYGPNGAGKTNLIEAVSMLSPGRGLRRASMDDLIRRPEALGWKITSVLQSKDQTHEISTFAEPTQSRQIRIDGKAAPRATLSFTPSHADAVLSYDKAMRERNRLLKDMVRDPHWYVALERQMAEAGATIHTNRQTTITVLNAAQANATTAFPTAELSLILQDGGTDRPDDPEALAEAFANGRPRDLAAGRALHGPHRSDLGARYADKGVLAKDCSTGEQKALLISLILANARALTRDFGAPPILLLDEVAAHLDASRRAALYDEICALGAQAWMTGTGPDLFAELGPRAQYIAVGEDAGVSTVSQRTTP